MIKVQQLSGTHRGQAMALALMAAGLLALAALGGYEIGSTTGQAHAAQAPAAQPQTCSTTDAPPATGFQP